MTPLYEYQCEEHGVFDEFKSVADSGLTMCPKCKKLCAKIISPCSFVLEGEGWSKDNYGKKARAAGRLK